MKDLFIILLLLSIGSICAQDFSFEITFEDAAGNQDSITLGYDENGTNGIDPAFGEVNIISVPYNAGLDVRISDEWANRTFQSIPGTYHTKTQIYEKNCPIGFWIHSVDIVTENWPVTATWDNSLFNDPCRTGSVFTSITPGGWWDTGSPSDLLRAELLNINSVTFTSNYDGSFNENYAYMNDNGDIIPVFWTTFGDERVILGIPENKEIDIVLSPNPASDLLNFQLNNLQTKIEDIVLFDLTGKRIDIDIQEDNLIYVGHLKRGLYFIEFTSNDGRKVIAKFIKN